MPLEDILVDPWPEQCAPVRSPHDHTQELLTQPYPARCDGCSRNTSWEDIGCHANLLVYCIICQQNLRHRAAACDTSGSGYWAVCEGTHNVLVPLPLGNEHLARQMWFNEWGVPTWNRPPPGNDQLPPVWFHHNSFWALHRHGVNPAPAAAKHRIYLDKGTVFLPSLQEDPIKVRVCTGLASVLYLIEQCSSGLLGGGSLPRSGEIDVLRHIPHVASFFLLREE